MDYIIVPIRFPKFQYQELKEEAKQKGMSFASVVREKTSKKKHVSPEDELKFITAHAKKMAKKYPRGKSLSDLLIEMRYE